MKPKHILTALLCATAMGGLAVVQAAATPVEIDPAKSRVTATIRQMGVAVEGAFTSVTGTVQFDPAAPESGATRLVIDTTSFDIGMSDFNKEVAKAEWLDSKRYPEAVFTAEGLKSLGNDRYEVTGSLDLKGKTVEVTTELTVADVDGGRSFSGEWSMDRQDFDIGSSGWDGVVDDTVLVRFVIHQPDAPN
jgi:polyisoprenoid-binding protein YceI